MDKLKSLDPIFGKGILVASGFDLGAKSPLDSRSVVNTIAERNAHAINNRAYEGMLVYVKENKITYQYVENNWIIFSFDTNVLSDYVTKAELDQKIDKVEGMGLSSNDFTDSLKAKLELLENYDDAYVQQKLQLLEENMITEDYINSEVGTILTSTDNAIELKSTNKTLSTIEYMDLSEVMGFINTL